MSISTLKLGRLLFKCSTWRILKLSSTWNVPLVVPYNYTIRALGSFYYILTSKMTTRIIRQIHQARKTCKENNIMVFKTHTAYLQCSVMPWLKFDQILLATRREIDTRYGWNTAPVITPVAELQRVCSVARVDFSGNWPTRNADTSFGLQHYTTPALVPCLLRCRRRSQARTNTTLRKIAPASRLRASIIQTVVAMAVPLLLLLLLLRGSTSGGKQLGAICCHAGLASFDDQAYPRSPQKWLYQTKCNIG